MKAALVKIDITPSFPVFLAGYGRTEKSDGILDSIQINTMLLEFDDNIYVYSYLDSIMLTHDFTESIRESVSKLLPIKQENINVGCIHTHSAPAYFKLHFEETHIELELQNSAQKEIVRSIVEAYNKRVECHVEIGSIDIEGLYGNRNRIDGPSDKTLSVLKFMISENNNLFNCINISAHPTILGRSNLKLSGDLLGWIRNKYELLSSTPTMIFNGTTGDVSTRFYRNELANNELDHLSGAIIDQMTKIAFVRLNLHYAKYGVVKYTTISDFRNDEFNNAFINKPNKTPLEEHLKERALQKADWSPFKLELISTILVVNNLILICLPGDVVSTFGLKIRAMFKDYNVLISCYSNTYTNYIVNEEEYGKYFETALSRCHKGEADHFIDLVISKTKELI